MTFKIITDSTCDLPKEVVQHLGITVVPLTVHFGSETYKDGVELSADEFYHRLMTEPNLPKTSQPSVGEFVQAYESVIQGGESIISLHLSSRVSGTYNSAIQASRQISGNCDIKIVDTEQVSMGLGLIVMAAAKLANQDTSMEETLKYVREAIKRCECFALLDTMEYLEKGGRIGKARALLGTFLNIKPLIILRNGEVHELGKERSRTRAIERLIRETERFAPIDQLCVLYSTTQEEAGEVAYGMKHLLVEGNEPMVAQFGPVLGTYVGPNTLGVALQRVSQP